MPYQAISRQRHNYLRRDYIGNRSEFVDPVESYQQDVHGWARTAKNRMHEHCQSLLDVVANPSMLVRAAPFTADQPRPPTAIDAIFSDSFGDFALRMLGHANGRAAPVVVTLLMNARREAVMYAFSFRIDRRYHCVVVRTTAS